MIKFSKIIILFLSFLNLNLNSSQNLIINDFDIDSSRCRIEYIITKNKRMRVLFAISAVCGVIGSLNLLNYQWKPKIEKIDLKNEEDVKKLLKEVVSSNNEMKKIISELSPILFKVFHSINLNETKFNKNKASSVKNILKSVASSVSNSSIFMIASSVFISVIVNNIIGGATNFFSRNYDKIYYDISMDWFLKKISFDHASSEILRVSYLLPLVCDEKEKVHLVNITSSISNIYLELAIDVIAFMRYQANYAKSVGKNREFELMFGISNSLYDNLQIFSLTLNELLLKNTEHFKIPSLISSFVEKIRSELKNFNIYENKLLYAID